MCDYLNQDKIDIKIAELENIANTLPGVLIIHNIHTGSVVWMSEKGLRELGITATEITKISGEEYYRRFFNPEDAKDYTPRLFDLLKRNDKNESFTYFQQVRISKLHDWTWHVSSTKIFMHDDAGLPLLSITMSFAIDSMHRMNIKAERLLEENNFLRKNLHIYSRLSKREVEILKLMASGHTALETADILFISVKTVETHRKNIKQKLETNSSFELSKYARAFDLI